MSRVPSDLPLHVEAEGLLAITYHWDGQSRLWNAYAPCEYSDVVQPTEGCFRLLQKNEVQPLTLPNLPQWYKLYAKQGRLHPATR